MFKFLQSPHLAISYCATSVSEVKASSSVWLLDRVYKWNWFSRASLKVALWETRQKSAPTSKTAFMWHVENKKGSPVTCQSVPQSPPEGQVNGFFPGLQGRNRQREVKRLTPGLAELMVELELRMPGSLSPLSRLCPPSQPSPPKTIAQFSMRPSEKKINSPMS